MTEKQAGEPKTPQAPTYEGDLLMRITTMRTGAGLLYSGVGVIFAEAIRSALDKGIENIFPSLGLCLVAEILGAGGFLLSQKADRLLAESIIRSIIKKDKTV